MELRPGLQDAHVDLDPVRDVLREAVDLDRVHGLVEGALGRPHHGDGDADVRALAADDALEVDVVHDRAHGVVLDLTDHRGLDVPGDVQVEEAGLLPAGGCEGGFLDAEVAEGAVAALELEAGGDAAGGAQGAGGAGAEGLAGLGGQLRFVVGLRHGFSWMVRRLAGGAQDGRPGTPWEWVQKRVLRCDPKAACITRTGRRRTGCRGCSGWRARPAGRRSPCAGSWACARAGWCP